MLIIDGDVLAYRFAHSEQRAVCFDHDLWTYYAELEPAKAHVEGFIEELKGATGEREVILTLSDVDANFRKDLPRIQYKATRMGERRPLVWKPLREWMLAELGARWQPLLEGDDMLGLLAKQGDVIASIDKDMQTIPGFHYNWDRPQQGVTTVTPEAARRFFLTQVLTGDRVDNYKGVPGIGPVNARRILDAGGLEWSVVEREFRTAGLGADVALETARAAWILRGDDYNFETNAIRQWTPERLEGLR
jgi:DNA polymerase-1